MNEIYTSYKCKACGSEFVLLTEEVESILKGRYLVCPYCSSRRISKAKAVSDLRECMKERAYIRVRGALRQIK